MSVDYQVVTITEALVDKVESLKVELEAQEYVITDQRSIIEALRSEHSNQADETLQEKMLAETLYLILDLINDAGTYDVDPVMLMNDVKTLALETLAETNYSVEEM